MPEAYREERRPSTGGHAGDSRLLHLAMRLVARRGPLACLTWLVGALAVASLARVAAGTITNGVPLAFYFPAITVVALFAGWGWGMAAVFLSAILAWLLFLPPTFTPHIPDARQAETLVFWVLIAGTQVVIAQFLRLALQRAMHGETRYRKLLDVSSGNIWTTDEAGEIAAPQAGWTDLTGMEWPDYAGSGWLKAVHPEDQSRLTVGRHASSGQSHETELRLWDGHASDWRWFVARSVAVPRMSGAGHEWITSLHDIHEHKLATDRRDLVIGELRHRLKNLITIIDSLAKSSRGGGERDGNVEAFLSRFLGRLHALGAAADLVLANRNVSVECGALIRATLSPFIEERSSRFLLSGPDLYLSEATGGTLGMAIHEMATNALKYGALSNNQGTVSVRWSAQPLADELEKVIVEWKERDGPQASAPSREGFGTRLIRSVPARERSGEVDLQYQPDGLYCRIAFVRTADDRLLTDPARNAAE